MQQALALLNAMPLPNGKTKVVVEQPGYHLFLAHLKLHNTPALGVERTARGVNLARLEALFKREDVRYFYTMPRFHNPLGTSLSNADKQRIVELANRYDVYIIEDDYLADFEQDAGQMPMYYDDTNQRVIYLKSYSKIMLPGLRVGVAVLPDALVGAFQQHKRTTDFDSSMISQAALELYITSGMFQRHRDEVRESYISNSRRLYTSLSKHAEPFLKPGTFVHPASVCMKAHIVLPNRITQASAAACLCGGHEGALSGELLPRENHEIECLQSGGGTDRGGRRALITDELSRA
ncbi:PLP-dependent aminotransferase family protein [Paenibacillus thiaminolyticus]|uniref:PLP-dependent aminotransferase family protein n=2 Tax=Paenibacillus thiaminolyticus TaxID=49283 RepID=A0A3A3GEL7_PANTH|nr:PLP-dependent aminotransferase family protein [Paenibacillus thiaminolyticus]